MSKQPRNLKHQRVESHMAVLSLIKKAFSEQNDRLNGSTEWRLPKKQVVTKPVTFIHQCFLACGKQPQNKEVKIFLCRDPHI